MSRATEPTSRVVQPDAGTSFWQPVPANGFVELKISGVGQTGMSDFDSGTQTVAAGCFVREHVHDDCEELIFCFEGSGTALVDGAEHPMQPGTLLYLASGSRHKFTASADGPLRFLWVLMPGGLSDFFRAIGRPRTAGEPAPEPFPRPENVEQIERDTVFGRLGG